MGKNDSDYLSETAGQPELFISTAHRDSEAVGLLNETFHLAAKNGISDVHIENEEYYTQIRFREGNSLIEYKKINSDMMLDVSAKIRMRAKLSIADVRKPLDGRFTLKYDDGLAVDVRVSLLPTIYGQSIVCRLLDQRNATRKLDDIHMSPLVRETIDSILEEPDGLFLVTGPTGSGKTSTLYAMLNKLNTPDKKILTIEDPVEYRVPGLQQVNIEPGVTFADALRAGLRQDPDIILIGEIRDSETAKIAVQASMTGHLVFSTLHTNDAGSTVSRMLDLGVDPFTLGSALKAVCAQRLLLKLDDRHERQEPTEDELDWLKLHGVRFNAETRFGTPVREGGSTGYAGRVPVLEMLTMDTSMKKAVLRNDRRAIAHAALQQPQYESLAQAAASLSMQGMTSLTEARRITSSLDALGGAKRLGERMIEMGLLTTHQLQVALEKQQEAIKEGHKERLGDIIVALGYASMEHVNETFNSLGTN